jgi:hypothetical protein
LPVHLVVADDEGVVMKSLRQLGQMTHGRRLPGGIIPRPVEDVDRRRGARPAPREC